ncbi:hypothetical protein G6F68_011335 [Rhizopus microsporus]|nr:hypothetical protein G6F68_011335 [Rhizopus microsporus]
MRSREFLMKDAYSFHLHDECLVREYENMKSAYSRIFTRLGLDFRMVQADSGAIGGDASQEFHVIADSGEDALVFSTGSDYAAHMEAAIAADPAPRAAAGEALRKVDTPTQKTCEDVAALLGIDLQRTVKSVALIAGEGEAQQFVHARGGVRRRGVPGQDGAQAFIHDGGDQRALAGEVAVRSRARDPGMFGQLGDGRGDPLGH